MLKIIFEINFKVCKSKMLDIKQNDCEELKLFKIYAWRNLFGTNPNHQILILPLYTTPLRWQLKIYVVFHYQVNMYKSFQLLWLRDIIRSHKSNNTCKIHEAHEIWFCNQGDKSSKFALYMLCISKCFANNLRIQLNAAKM